jgi:membrane-associated protease RseP (regulator of RpoE activity)
MSRKFLLLALSASVLFSLANQASAQKAPRADDLQRRIAEVEAATRRLKGQPANGNDVMAWGDARLTPVDARLQEKLGLPENEGMVIAAVAPNSVAERAGLKAADVLVKINNKAVPSDLDGFVKFIKEQKPEEAVDLVVVRNGKEETLKGVRMPANVQAGGGGRFARPMLPNPLFPLMPVNPGRLPNNPFFPAGVEHIRLEMTVNGAKIIRDQKANQFSGEYAKDDLKITISGKIENGFPRLTEVTLQEGKEKEARKFTSPKDVPVQHRAIIQQLMPSPILNMLMMPAMPNLRDFPGLPVIPGIDN